MVGSLPSEGSSSGSQLATAGDDSLKFTSIMNMYEPFSSSFIKYGVECNLIYIVVSITSNLDMKVLGRHVLFVCKSTVLRKAPAHPWFAFSGFSWD